MFAEPCTHWLQTVCRNTWHSEWNDSQRWQSVIITDVTCADIIQFALTKQVNSIHFHGTFSDVPIKNITKVRRVTKSFTAIQPLYLWRLMKHRMQSVKCALSNITHHYCTLLLWWMRRKFMTLGILHQNRDFKECEILRLNKCRRKVCSRDGN